MINCSLKRLSRRVYSYCEEATLIKYDYLLAWINLNFPFPSVSFLYFLIQTQKKLAKNSILLPNANNVNETFLYSYTSLCLLPIYYYTAAFHSKRNCIIGIAIRFMLLRKFPFLLKLAIKLLISTYHTNSFMYASSKKKIFVV